MSLTTEQINHLLQELGGSPNVNIINSKRIEESNMPQWYWVENANQNERITQRFRFINKCSNENFCSDYANYNNAFIYIDSKQYGLWLTN